MEGPQQLLFSILQRSFPEFLSYLNAWIVARELDMTIERMHSRWFKETAWIKRLADQRAGMR